MSLKTRIPVLAAAIALACTALGDDPLRMQVVPAIDGFNPMSGTIPVAVNLRNDGPNAKGVLRVIGAEGFQMDYPVELPRGSQKRLLTYPTVEYGGLRYVLSTDQGNVLKNFEPANFGGMDGAMTTALLISDNSGDLSFLRTKRKEDSPGFPPQSDQGGIQDVYTSPDLAPNRPVGYTNLATVFLGPGSERLSDEQVHALKLYALAGGTLVFLGGASSPVLGDARWQDLLPAHDFHTVNLPNSSALERLGNEATPTVTVMSGTPIGGAVVRRDGSTLLTAERGFGVGKVVYLAFNPLEPPLNKWEGRKGAVSRSVRLGDWQARSEFFNQFSMQAPAGMRFATMAVPVRAPSPYSRSYVATGTAVAYPAAAASGDPFSTKLPPTEKVFTLLGAYFLVVVPLNFLVLRKLKRGELAWFTAPLISLGFAGAFFSSAQGLYSAKMSTAAQGILIGQVGMEEGLFVGSSQLFVPQSGTYDLKFHSVDSLSVAPTNQPYYGRPSRQTADFDPVDVGEIVVPQMRANNLAFREIGYRQRVPIGRWFMFETKRTGPNSVHCSVRNVSDYTLENPSVMVGSTESRFGELKPGESKELDVTATDTLADSNQGTWSLPQILARYRGIALLGTVRGYRPGPQLGQQVDGRTSIRLTLFAKEALGPK